MTPRPVWHRVTPVSEGNALRTTEGKVVSVSETVTAEVVEASAPVTKTITIVRPTPGLVREYLVAKGERSANSRAKIGTDEKVAYLRDHPEVTRFLAREAGMTEGYGSRGLIASKVYEAVAESL